MFSRDSSVGYLWDQRSSGSGTVRGVFLIQSALNFLGIFFFSAVSRRNDKMCKIQDARFLTMIFQPISEKKSPLCCLPFKNVCGKTFTFVNCCLIMSQRDTLVGCYFKIHLQNRLFYLSNAEWCFQEAHTVSFTGG